MYTVKCQILTFTALFLCDVAGVFQVIEREDVLHLSLSIDYCSWAILHTRLDLLAEESLEGIWLSVGDDCCQVLEKFDDFVLSEVLVGVVEHLIIRFVYLQGVHF